MSIANRDRVAVSFKPIENILRTVVDGAFMDWLAGSEAGRSLFARTRATVVHDRMVSRALDAFASDHNVRWFEKYHSIWFILNDEFLFRFKKGNGRGVSRNYPTVSAEAYHDPQQGNLFGFDHYDRLEVVYLLDQYKTKIERVLIVARNRKKIVWSYDLQKRPVIVKQMNRETIADSPRRDLVRRKAIEKTSIKVSDDK